jgi:hypothetical protein
MTTVPNDEAREESARRYPADRGEVLLSAGSLRNARREAFEKGAAWQASRPITDAQVEAALHAYHGTTPKFGFEWREGEPERMRAALEAARDAS